MKYRRHKMVLNGNILGKKLKKRKERMSGVNPCSNYAT